jgi:hypothetical protein
MIAPRIALRVIGELALRYVAKLMQESCGKNGAMDFFSQ